MIVSTDTFNAYSGNYEDSVEAVALKESFLVSAEEIVKAYLSYDPVLSRHDDVCCSGSGWPLLYLPARPVQELHSVFFEGVEKDVSLFRISDDRIRFPGGIFPKGVDNIVLSFTAGWDEAGMPEVIRVSILRIATLMLSETSGNIGLSGKSFSDQSRTFVNYTNYSKYLEPLNGYRIVRF